MSDFEVEFNLNKENPIEANFEVQDTQPFDIEMTIDSVGDKHFVFEQGIASDTWVIEHNLNKYPSVTVVDTAGNQFIPAVKYIDENKCIVTMNGATKGKAFLN